MPSVVSTQMQGFLTGAGSYKCCFICADLLIIQNDCLWPKFAPVISLKLLMENWCSFYFLTGLLTVLRWVPLLFFRLDHFLSQHLTFWLLNYSSSCSSSEANREIDSPVSCPSLIFEFPTLLSTAQRCETWQVLWGTHWFTEITTSWYKAV